MLLKLGLNDAKDDKIKTLTTVIIILSVVCLTFLFSFIFQVTTLQSLQEESKKQGNADEEAMEDAPMMDAMM